MLRRILLPLGSDPSSEAAFLTTVKIAKDHGATVTSVAIVDTTRLEMAANAPAFSAHYLTSQAVVGLEERQRETARQRIDTFLERAREAGIDGHGESMDGQPWRCLRRESRLHDLAVVGRTAHFQDGDAGLAGPGHTLHRLLDHSSCPVLVVSEPLEDVERVVIGFDGRAPSCHALRSFVRTGLYPDAEVQLLYFEEAGVDDEDLDSAKRYLESYDRSVTVIRGDGSAAKNLLEAADDAKAGLLVLGAHGKPRIAEWLLGSTTRKALKDSSRPVLVSA